MTQLAGDAALLGIRIVLVEPAGGLNVGSTARVMKNMGLSHLVLVNPRCDPLGDEARKMAVHAIDILETAIRVATIPEALQGCQRAIATTSRERSPGTPLEPPKIALPWLLECPAALIFGPEDRGLSNPELNYAQRFVQIPANPIYPSLNLAQSVAVCCYELYQRVSSISSPDQTINCEDQVSFSSPLAFSTQLTEASAPLEALEEYYQQLESVLLKIGYLYPHTAKSRMEKFRRLFNRANLSTTEVAMLRGIFTQVEWALRSS
ncbi:MAG: RNA methyltransferase [Microcoleaceae cyanobacterium]